MPPLIEPIDKSSTADHEHKSMESGIQTQSTEKQVEEQNGEPEKATQSKRQRLDDEAQFKPVEQHEHGDQSLKQQLGPVIMRSKTMDKTYKIGMHYYFQFVYYII